MKCVLGLHRWDGCKCSRCGKTRDEGHKWNGCKCSGCGKTRDEDHKWSGCKCTACGGSRDESHDWDDELRCRVCGKCAPDWIHTLARALMGLPISGVPPGEPPSVALNPLKTALFLTVNHIERFYPLLDASPETFTTTRKLKSKFGVYSCKVGSELNLRWGIPEGFSEDEITVKRHGDDAYSICGYKYRESDDDGGSRWYVNFPSKP